MSAGLPFYKVSGAGNDFVLIDAREAVPGLDPARWARAICPRRLSVGADGLIVVEPSGEATLRMTYVNADGSRAFCGNGTLCVARWAHEVGGFPAELTLETDEGIIPARVRGARVEIRLGPPGDLRPGVSLEPGGLAGQGTYVDVGCPHLVVFCETWPEDDRFAAQASALRRHPDLGEAGANVDFAMVEDPHRLRLRVFERGVEAETLASGTGCLAAALAASERGLAASPVSCLTQGGETLKVRFRRQESGYDALSLEGSVRLVYTGTLGPDLMKRMGPSEHGRRSRGS